MCSAAYADGSLSGGQVEAILAHLDDDTIDLFAACEAELVPYLAPLRVAGVGRAMAAWKEQARPEGPEPEEPERSLHLSRTLDDRYVLDGSLDAEGGATVATALRLATVDDTDASRSPTQRRADALVDVCRFFLDHQRAHKGGRHRPHLNMVVELDDLAEGRGGRVVAGPGAGRCRRAAGRRSTRPASVPRGRPVTAREAAVLVADDQGVPQGGGGHHVVWVTDGGPTELANLVVSNLTSIRSRLGTSVCTWL
ncbi:MAG: 13E12 repeat family protein [Actinomycetota bacterium]|nr:13E12 repeat family protein [Actinomycetota bacterium]